MSVYGVITQGYGQGINELAVQGYLAIRPQPTGGGGGRRRRPGEKVIWYDDWLKAQEELTEFKALPEAEQIEVAQEAIKEVKATTSTTEAVVDAKEAIESYNAATDALLQLEELNILLIAYFMLQFERRREEDDIAAMLMLGML